MTLFLSILAVLCFILMIGCKKQEDRNNCTIALCVVIFAIMVLYT